MAIQVSDIAFYVIPETVIGTTPATPVFKKFDISSGDLSITPKVITSDVLRGNRAAADQRQVSADVGASFKAPFMRSTTQELFWSSCLSGSFTTNVLKAGSTDSSVTFEKKTVNGATVDYQRQASMICSKIDLSVTPDGFAEASYDFVGTTRTQAAAIVTGATYVADVAGQEYAGVDVGTITIGALTAKYTSLDLSIEQTRSALYSMGSASAFSVGTSGVRTIKLTATIFREDMTPETALVPNVTVPVSIVFGTGTANQYTIALPAALPAINSDSTSGESALVSIDFYAKWDATAMTDISITKN